MQKTFVQRSLVAVAGSIAMVTSVAAIARDLVPLRRGTYVQTDTACAEASNATMQTYTGRGFDTASEAQCVARPIAGKPGQYAQTCTDYRQPAGAPKTRSTETLTLRVQSPTRYTVDGTRFRFCPGVQ